MMINVLSDMMMVKINLLNLLMMKIIFLIGTMVIKNEKPRRHKKRKNFCLLPGTHQDIGIGSCQKMIKKRKIVGINMDLFISDDRIQKFF